MHYIQKRTVTPALYPVTVAECKADLRIQHSAEDDLIESLIADATDYMDAPNGVIGKALITQTWEISTRISIVDSRIYIPITPVQEISSIQYYDAENATQSLDVDDFLLIGDENSAFIEPLSGTSWPSTYDRPDAVKITVIAGFGDYQNQVPNSIRRAIRLLVAHWFEHRHAVTESSYSEMPLAVENLVGINRKGWVA